MRSNSQRNNILEEKIISINLSYSIFPSHLFRRREIYHMINIFEFLYIRKYYHLIIHLLELIRYL